MIDHCAALFVENLVMEQADSGECQYHVVFIAGFDHIVVTDRAARFCDVLYTGAVCSFDVVTEWEEGIRTQRYAGQGIQPMRVFPLWSAVPAFR